VQRLPPESTVVASIDHGASWSDASSGIAGAAIDQIVVTPGGSLAALSAGAVWARASADVRFTRSTGLPAEGVRTLAAGAGDTVFALARGGSLYRSTESGAAFSDITPSLSRPWLGLLLAASAAELDVLVHDGDDFELLISTDGGGGWTETPMPTGWASANDLLDAKLLVDADWLWILPPATGTLFISADHGHTLTQTSIGCVGVGVTCGIFDEPYPFLDLPLLVDASLPIVPGLLFLGGYRNWAGGDANSWVSTGVPGPGFAVAQLGDVFLVSTGTGLSVSLDRTSSWVSLPLFASGPSIGTMSMDPTRAETVWLGTKDLPAGGPQPGYGAGVWELVGLPRRDP
jgi:hypothetical protein